MIALYYYNIVMNYQQYLKLKQTLKGTNKDCLWEQRIINTKLPCYGKTATKARQIVKELDPHILKRIKIKDHLDSIVCAFLINKINDFKIYKYELNKYVKTIDNWASCDTLKFNRWNKKDLISLSTKCLSSKNEFSKRVGINFYFEIIKDKQYLNNAFDILDNLKNEKHYYANMAGAWLLAECFVKYRNETLEYFTKTKTNNFIINKAISKCHDSFRVLQSDKELLKKYKRY